MIGPELSQPPVFRRVRNWTVNSVGSAKWKPDDRLHSVQKLADMLHVSRGSTREALFLLGRGIRDHQAGRRHVCPELGR